VKSSQSLTLFFVQFAQTTWFLILKYFFFVF